MSITARHPLYVAYAPDWEQLDHCHAGERIVKAQTTTYLPATSGMVLDGMNTGQAGKAAYDAYLLRAKFPEYVRDAIEAALGMLHSQPATIEVPKRLEPMLKSATISGESLQTLLRRINEAQLKHGRFGLLLEVPDGRGPDALPYVATYAATAILNWDESAVGADGKSKLNLVVLDETGQQRQGFEWKEVEQWRVLTLRSMFEDNVPTADSPQGEVTLPNTDAYMVSVFTQKDVSLNEGSFTMPQIAGKPLEQIPFVFVNTNDLAADPTNPPLLGLSNLALSVYRLQADYRQSLFMQGQDTLVVTGVDAEFKPRIGANSFIALPDSGDAKFIGVNSEGLAEQREAILNEEKKAAEKGARLTDFSDSSRQSGEALRVRLASQTATLTTIALAGAEALAQILRYAAEWVGADPEEVIVKPNLEFADEVLTGGEVKDWMSAKMLGAPISNKSLHRLLRKQNLTQMEYEDELDELEGEKALEGGTGVVEDPTQPVEDVDANA